SYASLPSAETNDQGDDDNDEDEENGAELGSAVRLESLQPEERQALFDTLDQLEENPRLKYFTFRTILNQLLTNSVLPRLNETQIRSLLNDLANREPPILIRSTKRGRNPAGITYTFSSFQLTKDRDLLQVHMPEHDEG